MDRATNGTLMRFSNQRLLLDLIRKQPISRADLAERTRLTRSAVTMIVEQLIRTGLVMETTSPSSGQPGRKRVHLELNQQARFIFGVSLVRSHCEIGTVDLGGRVLLQEECDLNGENAEANIRLIAAMIRSQQERLHLEADKVLGIGITAPGPVDYRNGVILNPPNFNAWHGVPVADALFRETGFESYLENVSNALALEEKYFGVAKKNSNYMIVLIDDGVGSGVVVNDRLYRGARGLGNEIGHTSIAFNGRPCECGNCGCLEKYASVPALVEQTPFSSWKEVVDTAKQLPYARSLVDLAAQYLAVAIVNAFNLYDLEQVILTGDVCYEPEMLLRRLNELLSARVINRESLHRPLAVAGGETNRVRASAMPVFYSFFQGSTGV